MDKGKNGLFNIEEFIYNIQGEMNEARIKCVDEISEGLSKNTGSITKSVDSCYQGGERNEWRTDWRANGITKAGYRVLSV